MTNTANTEAARYLVTVTDAKGWTWSRTTFKDGESRKMHAYRMRCTRRNGGLMGNVVRIEDTKTGDVKYYGNCCSDHFDSYYGNCSTGKLRHQPVDFATCGHIDPMHSSPVVCQLPLGHEYGHWYAKLVTADTLAATRKGR